MVDVEELLMLATLAFPTSENITVIVGDNKWSTKRFSPSNMWIISPVFKTKYELEKWLLKQCKYQVESF